jgi:hypothetical protein
MTHISQAIHPRAVYKDLFRVPAITAYNRLEARPRTVDFSRSLRAEVRDALWLLTRQWQMGEFQAEDAASPIDARLATRLARFDRVSFAGGPPQPYDESVPLEVAVEREDFPWTLPARIEAGQRFLGLLAPAVRAAVLAPARAAFALEADPDWSKQADTLALYRVAAARAIDGARLLASHAAGTLAATLGAAPADVTDAADAVAAWRRRVFGAPQGTGGRAWIPDRLAYDVRIATPLADGEQALLTARRYAEGRLDWYAFDAGATGERLPAPAGAPPPAAARADTLSFVPTAAAFPGGPPRQLWRTERQNHRPPAARVRGDGPRLWQRLVRHSLRDAGQSPVPGARAAGHRRLRRPHAGPARQRHGRNVVAALEHVLGGRRKPG